MKTITYNIGGRELRLDIDFERGAIRTVEGIDAPSADEEAALAAAAALALLDYEAEPVHDKENGSITIKPRATAWNNPALGLIASKFK